MQSNTLTIDILRSDTDVRNAATVIYRPPLSSELFFVLAGELAKMFAGRSDEAAKLRGPPSESYEGQKPQKPDTPQVLGEQRRPMLKAKTDMPSKDPEQRLLEMLDRVQRVTDAQTSQQQGGMLLESGMIDSVYYFMACFFSMMKYMSDFSGSAADLDGCIMGLTNLGDAVTVFSQVPERASAVATRDSAQEVELISCGH